MAKRSQPVNTSTSGEQARGLPPDVAERFKLAKGVLMHFYCTEFGRVDLTKINMMFAEQLAAAGYLEKIA